MTTLFAPEPLRFSVPAPQSKKNRGKIISWGAKCPRCGKRERQAIRPSDTAKRQEKAIRDYLELALRCDEPHFADADVRVVGVYHARSEQLGVRVEHVQPRPKGFTGRKRDLANLLEVLLDAMQGPVYANDNQVSDIQVIRALT